MGVGRGRICGNEAQFRVPWSALGMVHCLMAAKLRQARPSELEKGGRGGATVSNCCVPAGTRALPELVCGFPLSPDGGDGALSPLLHQHHLMLFPPALLLLPSSCQCFLPLLILQNDSKACSDATQHALTRFSHVLNMTVLMQYREASLHVLLLRACEHTRISCPSNSWTVTGV